MRYTKFGLSLILHNNKLVKITEERRGFALKDSINSLLELKRAFKVPLWRVLLSGLQMKKAYEIPASELGNAAAGNLRIKKALIEGDAEWGFMPGGQVCDRINDVPTCQELVQRIVKEADDIISELGSIKSAA